ncbi:MAG TPA: hypothetical protein VMJ34_12830 [Bryobacteraceae bacterium]|nr:hypothetical protein [Bryobacteraceae bacterium]
MFSAAGKFLHHVLPGVVRPMRVLWNQFIGFIFLVLATFVGMATWRRSSAGEESLVLVVGGFAFAAFLAWFAISSFWRARKISRQQ